MNYRRQPRSQHASDGLLSHSSCGVPQSDAHFHSCCGGAKVLNPELITELVENTVVSRQTGAGTCPEWVGLDKDDMPLQVAAPERNASDAPGKEKSINGTLNAKIR